MTLELRYTLLADGTSDAALIPVIDWLLRDIEPGITIDAVSANPEFLPSPREGLANRIAAAARLFPCDLLFVHRDAEGQPAETRRAEITEAVDEAGILGDSIPIVPVRMTEAWLLTDEGAIREAAGNPNGSLPLALPHIATIEGLSDPKQELMSLLSAARGATTRRRMRERRLFTAATQVRVAQATASFARLDRLRAFQRLRHDVEAALASLP